MKYVLPTQHILYSGLQAKKDKLDAAGDPNCSNRNIAEIHNQVLMCSAMRSSTRKPASGVSSIMLSSSADGEITKAAKNWLGGKLDTTKRSQIMFMDREDILNL